VNAIADVAAASRAQRLHQQSDVQADVNAVVGGLLRDLAFAQASPQKMFGYKRAAAAVLSLEQPLTDLAEPGGAIRKTPGIGPASTRIIREVLETGRSATVEDAVVKSGNAAEIYRRRALRGTFFSRAQVLRILADPALDGPDQSDYHGDLQMHSEWSDGSPTLEEMVSAATDRGWTFAAVTDHSYGLKIAGGMSMEEAERQQQVIDRINAPRWIISAYQGNRSEHRQRRRDRSVRGRDAPLRARPGRAAFATQGCGGPDRAADSGRSDAARPHSRASARTHIRVARGRRRRVGRGIRRGPGRKRRHRAGRRSRAAGPRLRPCASGQGCRLSVCPR
jgi:hypothetical protein